MKTLHLGIITSLGIVAVTASGIFLINYESPTPMCIEGRLPNGTCAGPIAIDLGTSEKFVRMECDTSYVPPAIQNITLPNGTIHTVNKIPVFLMKPNSTGKICATYHNPSSPTQSSVRVFAAKDVQQMASEITASAYPDIVPTGNSTIVYDIKTGSQAGFYGMSFFCDSIPFAVGYDNQSRIILDDFPWLYKNDICLSQTNVFQITGLSGIDVKYVTVAHRG